MARRAECPVCKKDVGVNLQGRLMKHGRRRSLETGKPCGDFCAGTDMDVLPSRVLRTVCHVCERDVATDAHGCMVLHGYKRQLKDGEPCAGSYKKSRQVA